MVQAVNYGKEEYEMSVETIYKGSSKVFSLKAASNHEREEWMLVLKRACVSTKYYPMVSVYTLVMSLLISELHHACRVKNLPWR